ncbi:MAG: hypothetical protein ACTSPV_12240, partial [Candidatus Hodarchaeales archaeon]
NIRLGFDQYLYGVLEGLTGLYSKVKEEAERRNAIGMATTGLGVIVTSVVLIKKYGFIRRKKTNKI